MDDISYKSKYRKISPKLMDLTKEVLWTEPASEWSMLHSCDFSLNASSKHLIASFSFSVPQRDLNMRVVNADAFMFWNSTKVHKYCLMRYDEPSTILVNTSNQSYESINPSLVNANAIWGLGCCKPGAKFLQGHRLFKESECTNYKPDFAKTIQFKNLQDATRGYCYGANISISSEPTQACPPYPFRLPGNLNFSVNGYKQESSSLKAIASSIDDVISSVLSDQLDIHALRIFSKTGDTLKNQVTHFVSSAGMYVGNVTRSLIPDVIQDTGKQLVKYIDDAMFAI